MTAIDINSWKPFMLSSLFDIYKGKRLTKANMLKGDIHYIGATAYNNGITAKIGNKESLHPAGTITVCYNGSIGQAFYQEQPYWATDDVNVLYPKFEMTPRIAHFICPIIKKMGQNFAYVDKWTAEKMRTTSILLPAIDKNTPNWQYMEDYMRGIEQRTLNAFITLDNIAPTRKKINYHFWQSFLVRDIFITEKNGQQVPTGANVSQKELKPNGSTPRISVTSLNNGILGYYDYTGDSPKDYRVFSNFISVSFLGTVFYHQNDASLDMKVHCLKPRDVELNSYTGTFLVSAIKASLNKFIYSDQLSSTKLPHLTICLPKTQDNDPDWQYMEMFMRGVEAMAKNKIDALQQSKQSVSPTAQTPITNYGTVNIIDNSRNYNIK